MRLMFRLFYCFNGNPLCGENHHNLFTMFRYDFDTIIVVSSDKEWFY